MMTVKIVVLMVAGVLAVVGVGTAIADLGSSDDSEGPAQNIELRKDDSGADTELVDEEDEGDGDGTRGDDGTRGGNNTGDRDGTRGNDGTSGGNNTPVAASVNEVHVAPPPAPAPAPALAPAYSDDGGGYSDDGGYSD
jgi:hypothetical protein